MTKSVFDILKEKVQNSDKKVKIVFPEANDPRVINAVERLAQEKIIEPILINNDSVAGVASYDQAKDLLTELAKRYPVARRKEVSLAEISQNLQDVNYYATMLVESGYADGLVSGATHSTADTVRPGLQLIHTAQGMKRVSGAMIMEKGEQRFIFSDCAINIDPDADTLCEIAYQSAQTAKMIGLTPKVAFLSFSTKGSAKGDMVSKVQAAASKFKEFYPEIPADGELQFDAAFVPEVAKQKAPDSEIAGQANVFVFPELQSGNIGYKMVQRLGGFLAVGPILQGMNKPVNDLSRGASAEDIYQLAILTAAQALEVHDENNN
ncbi:MAG: phosphate acetyltransferase [Lactobacillus sp.]|nr:phosphate acetyltransferase [Lactobacillus sp.]